MVVEESDGGDGDEDGDGGVPCVLTGMDTDRGGILQCAPQGAWERWNGDPRRSLSCSEGSGDGGEEDEDEDPLPSLLISARCSAWKVPPTPFLASPKAHLVLQF